MRRYTPEALWFIAGVVLFAGVAVWGAVGVGDPAPSYLAFWVLTVLAGMAHLYPIRSAREGAVYVLSNVFLFAAAIMLPPHLLAATGTLALVPLTWKQRQRPGALIRFAFNAAQSVLAMLAAWSIIQMGSALHTGDLTGVALIMLAIFLFTSVQTAFVVVIIALNSRIPLSRVEGVDLISFCADALMPFLGALIACVWMARPAMLFLFLPPLIVIYRIMRNVQLIRRADLDAKTGLYNYSYFVHRMTQTLQYARLVRRPTAVLFADMDLLRDVNNTYGHLAGDLAIKHVADVLQKELPQSATVARFGGEEFVVLLPGTHTDEAEFIGWRVCREVSRTPVDAGDGRQMAVTVSVGVAGYPQHGATVEELVHAADQAVYQAKARGRNRVVSARSLGPEELRGPHPESRQPAATPAAPRQPAAAGPAGTAAPPARLPLQVSGGVRLLVGAVFLAAAAVLVWVLPGIGRLGVAPVLGIFAAAVTGSLFKVAVSEPGESGQFSVSLAIAAVMAAGALFGVPGAVLGAAAAAAAHLVLARQRSVVKCALSLSANVLGGLAGGLVLGLGLAPGRSQLAILVMLGVAAAAANYLTVGLLTAIVVSRQQERPLPEVLRGPLTAMAPHHITMGAVGAFMAISYIYLGLAGASMFVLPAALIHASIAERLRRSRERIASLEQIRQDLEAALKRAAEGKGDPAAG